MSTDNKAPASASPAKAKRRSRRPSVPESPPEMPPHQDSRQWITVRIEPELLHQIEAHAKAAGTNRSDAIRQCLAAGIETLHEREGVPGGRADELLEAIEGVRAAVDLLGPPTFGILRLVAHWATQGGGVNVNEDELLAELRNVGADEWEEALTDAERDLHDRSRVTPQTGRT